MKNKRGQHPFNEAEMPLDTALNPGVIVFNDLFSQETKESYIQDGGSDQADDEG